jgi:hypothetical protein
MPEVLEGITGYDLVLVSQLRISKKAYLSEKSDHFGRVPIIALKVSPQVLKPNFGG